MRRYLSSYLYPGLFFLCLLSLPAALAAQERVEIEASSDFYSQYVWRGLPASKGFVWQPSFSLEYYGVGLNVWGNFPVAPQPNQGEFNEVDLTLYYSREVKPLNIVSWVVLEFYPHNNPKSLDSGDTTAEWGLHLDAPLGPIELFTDIGVELFDASGAFFWGTGLAYQKTLPWSLSVRTSALFGMANGIFTAQYIAPVGTVPFLFEWSLAFPWTPLKHWTFTPKMAVSTLLTDSLRNASSDPNIIWGGLSVVFSWSPAP